MKEQTENHFIVNFKEKLNEVPNNEYLIQNELNQIELFTSGKSNGSNSRTGLGFSSNNNLTNSVFDLSHYGSLTYFNQVFHEYLLHGSMENSTIQRDVLTDHFYFTAIRFAEYYIWLKSLVNNHPKPKKDTLSHKQKMLALHYLGLDLSKYDNTKSGNILGDILGLDKGNTRKYLSYVGAGKNDVRTKKNLQAVLNLFESQEITDISTKIKSDIDSLS